MSLSRINPDMRDQKKSKLYKILENIQKEIFYRHLENERSRLQILGFNQKDLIVLFHRFNILK
jgi:hypothetical protein